MIIKEDRTGRAERAPRPKFDRYTFTVFFNDSTEQSFCVQKLLEYDALNPMKFIVVGIELSPNTNRLHLQGYFELTTVVRPRAVMRQLPGFHIEPARENREANIVYCEKGKASFKSEAPISSFDMGVWGSATPPSLSELDDEVDALDDSDFEDYEYTTELKRFLAWNDYMKSGNSLAYIPDGLWPEDVSFEREVYDTWEPDDDDEELQ